MLCKKCGYELSEKNRFCPKCGCKVETEIQCDNNTKAIKKKQGAKYVLAICILILIVATALVGNHFNRQKRFNELVSASEQYMNEKDWEEAVKYLKTAIGINPNVPSLYISLATAYVEQWDLYNAKATLDKGYDTTKDKSLKNVSIYGPLSAAETTVIYQNFDELPIITRCEYLFTDKNIYGYISGNYGLPIFTTKYIISDEKVKYISLIWEDARNYSTITRQLPDIMFGQTIANMDLQYWGDKINRCKLVYYDYDNDYEDVLSFLYGDGFVKISSEEYDNYISYSYDSQKRISSVNIMGDIMNFEYPNNGGWQIYNYDGSLMYEFNKICNCVFNFNFCNDDSTVTVDEFGHIIKVGNEYMSLKYNDDNEVTFVSYDSGQNFYYTEFCEYEKIGDESIIVEYAYAISSGANEPAHTKSVYKVNYDKQGKFIGFDMSIYDYDADHDIYEKTQDRKFMYIYDEDGKLTNYENSHNLYVLDYDDVGRRKVGTEVDFC